MNPTLKGCATLLLAFGLAVPRAGAGPFAARDRHSPLVRGVVPRLPRRWSPSAARDGKRVMIYIGQDGCPYCTRLMTANFSQPAIVDKTRRHFVAIALNLWGDRATVWTDGRAMPKRRWRANWACSSRPRCCSSTSGGRWSCGLDGYYPPQRFDAVLDYVAARKEDTEPLGDYLRRVVREPASPTMHDEPFFAGPPYDLQRRTGGKPLAVVFEAPIARPATSCIAKASRVPKCSRWSESSTSSALRSAPARR
jgi:thioredoxin-related protein